MPMLTGVLQEPQGADENPIVSPKRPSQQMLSHAPKWLKRPAGASFGFGGQLVSFTPSIMAVRIQPVVTEQPVVDRAQALSQVLSANNPSILSAFAQHQVQGLRLGMMNINGHLNPRRHMVKTRQKSSFGNSFQLLSSRHHVRITWRYLVRHRVATCP